MHRDSLAGVARADRDAVAGRCNWRAGKCWVVAKQCEEQERHEAAAVQ